MKAGSLRSRIAVVRAVLSGQDSYGTEIRTPTTFANWWAAIKPTTGRNAAFAMTFAPTVSHTITIRYLAGLLPTDQIQYGSRLFIVNGVTDPEERKREMVLYCTEVNIGGTQTLPDVEFDTLTNEQFDGLQ